MQALNPQREAEAAAEGSATQSESQQHSPRLCNTDRGSPTRGPPGAHREQYRLPPLGAPNVGYTLTTRTALTIDLSIYRSIDQLESLRFYFCIASIFFQIQMYVIDILNMRNGFRVIIIFRLSEALDCSLLVNIENNIF